MGFAANGFDERFVFFASVAGHRRGPQRQGRLEDVQRLDKWTPQEWNGKYRWLSTYKYPSYLDFALTTSHGKPFSEKGGHVVLDNPASQDQRRDEYPLRPNMDIVLLLLGRGANVSRTAVKAAKKIPDRAFLRLVESKAKEQEAAKPAGQPSNDVEDADDVEDAEDVESQEPGDVVDIPAAGPVGVPAAVPVGVPAAVPVGVPAAGPVAFLQPTQWAFPQPSQWTRRGRLSLPPTRLAKARPRRRLLLVAFPRKRAVPLPRKGAM